MYARALSLAALVASCSPPPPPLPSSGVGGVAATREARLVSGDAGEAQIPETPEPGQGANPSPTAEDPPPVTEPTTVAPDLAGAALSTLLAEHGVECWRNLPPEQWSAFDKINPKSDLLPAPTLADEQALSDALAADAEYEAATSDQKLTPEEKAALKHSLLGGKP
ncbi:MAG: hypothetical protein AMXMBFR64_37750 [Myxococcales bacterium]